MFIEANPDVLNTLLEVARVQSTGASNRVERIFTTDKRLKELVKDKAEPNQTKQTKPNQTNQTKPNQTKQIKPSGRDNKPMEELLAGESSSIEYKQEVPGNSEKY